MVWRRPVRVDEAAGLAEPAERRVDAGQPPEAFLPAAVTDTFLSGDHFVAFLLGVSNEPLRTSAAEVAVTA